jgi:hypothetical protein
MQNPFKRTEDKVDALINRVIEDMEMFGPDSEEYPKLIANLEKLHKLKADKKPSRVSPDTIAIIAGNLLGILIIVAYEEKHVITSKAFTMATTNRKSN